MIVIITKNVSAKASGLLSRWFTELMPNIFVSGLNYCMTKKIIDYVYQNSKILNLTLIRPERTVHGFDIEYLYREENNEQNEAETGFMIL